MRHANAWLAGLAALLALPASAGEPVLQLSGLTFVSSRRDANELVLSAERVRLEPEAHRAHLEVVAARLQGADGAPSFELWCDRGRIDLESSDFVAEGNVHGRTADGIAIRTAQARYDNATGLVSADTPVEIVRSDSTLTGDGFVYDTNRRRMRVLGASRMVQRR